MGTSYQISTDTSSPRPSKKVRLVYLFCVNTHNGNAELYEFILCIMYLNDPLVLPSHHFPCLVRPIRHTYRCIMNNVRKRECLRNTHFPPILVCLATRFKKCSMLLFVLVHFHCIFKCFMILCFL